MVGIGYVLGRTHLLGEHAHEVLSRLVFFVCTPALLFASLVTTDLSVVFSSTLVIAGGAALIIGLLYLLVARLWYVARYPNWSSGRCRRRMSTA